MQFSTIVALFAAGAAAQRTFPIRDLEVISTGIETVKEATNSFVTLYQFPGLDILSLDVLENLINTTVDFTLYGTLSADEARQVGLFYQDIAEAWKSTLDDATAPARKEYFSIVPHCVGDALALRLDEFQGAQDELSNAIVSYVPSAAMSTITPIVASISTVLESAITAFATVTCPLLPVQLSILAAQGQTAAPTPTPSTPTAQPLSASSVSVAKNTSIPRYIR